MIVIATVVAIAAVIVMATVVAAAMIAVTTVVAVAAVIVVAIAAVIMIAAVAAVAAMIVVATVVAIAAMIVIAAVVMIVVVIMVVPVVVAASVATYARRWDGRWARRRRRGGCRCWARSRARRWSRRRARPGARCWCRRGARAGRRTGCGGRCRAGLGRRRVVAAGGRCVVVASRRCRRRCRVCGMRIAVIPAQRARAAVGCPTSGDFHVDAGEPVVARGSDAHQRLAARKVVSAADERLHACAADHRLHARPDGALRDHEVHLGANHVVAVGDVDRAAADHRARMPGTVEYDDDARIARLLVISVCDARRDRERRADTHANQQRGPRNAVHEALTHDDLPAVALPVCARAGRWRSFAPNS